ncbi:MAG: GatB/YqeY domain-containing protein [Clostridia bacterium]
MLIDDIKKANIQALRDKDAIGRGIMSVLLNKIKLAEIAKRGTDNTQIVDADVVYILQKTIKELNEEIETLKQANRPDRLAEIERQRQIVNAFLPQLMSAEEIKKLIVALPSKDIGSVMKYFKTEFAGKCDMRVVQEVLKTL